MKIKKSIVINIVFLAIGLSGYYYNIEFLKVAFLILTWVGVMGSPIALLISPFLKHPSSSNIEMWFSRFTDLFTIIILFIWRRTDILLPALVIIEMFLLEMAWSYSKKEM